MNRRRVPVSSHPSAPPCARGCSVFRWRDGERLRVPRGARVGVLCQGCYDRLADMLAEIGDYLAMLDDVRERGVADVHQPGVKLRSVASEQAPLNLAVVTLEDPRTRQRLVEHADGTVEAVGPVSIAGVLSGWCDLVIEERRLTEEPHLVAECLAILRRHVDWCASRPWVGDMWAEVDTLHAQLGALVGEPRPEQVGHCPDCGGAFYLPRTEYEPLRCSRCGAEWPRSHWHLLAKVLTGAAS